MRQKPEKTPKPTMRSPLSSPRGRSTIGQMSTEVDIKSGRLQAGALPKVIIYYAQIKTAEYHMHT